MFQALFFFITSYELGHSLLFIFSTKKKKKKKRIEMIFAKNFARNYEKNSNTWNIRRLVGESFVSANQRSSVLCYRLTNFRTTDRLQEISRHLDQKKVTKVVEFDISLTIYGFHTILLEFIFTDILHH